VARDPADRSGAAPRQPQFLAAADSARAARSPHATSEGMSESPPDYRVMRSKPVGRGNHQMEPEDAYRARQQAGLDILAAIASHTSFAMAEAATTILPPLPAWPREHLDRELSGGRDEVVRGAGAADEGLGPVGSLLNRLRADHLVRNSLYLMVSTGLQAVLGFAFWIVMARLFSAEDVGKASSLISATTLLSYFALFGLNTTVMRFLPTATNKGALLTAVFVMVGAVAVVIAIGYVMLTPFIAPPLAFVARSPVMTAGFAVLAAAAAINVLTDSVFMASRRAEFCAVTDGLVGGGGRIVFGIILAGTGAYGLYLGAAGGFAAAALVGILIMIAILHWRPALTNPLQTLRPLLKFSGANYVANSMNLLPGVVVPLIVLDRLGAKAAGYYYVAFQMATILFTAAAAVEASFMAEGSQAGANWRVIRRRSRRLAIMIFVPAGLIMALAAHWILLAFTRGYSVHGTGSLEILSAAVLPIAACNWGWTVLRLTGRLRALVVSTAVYGAAICGSAWFLAPHGLTAVSSAWLAGSALGAAVSTILAAAAKAPARHRRGMRPRTEAGVAQP
jgi:O-antigen/teichoic acid export membrane protein